MSRVGKNWYMIESSDRAPLSGVDFDRILIIRREGKAMEFEPVTFNTTTQEMALYSFQRFSEKIAPLLPSDIYIQRVLNLALGGTRNQYFEIGTGINPAGRRYRMRGGLLGDVFYDTIAGDGRPQVLAGLVSALTAVGYSATISSNVLIVTMAAADSITADITIANALKYQSGLLVKLIYDLYGDTKIEEYLIEVNESADDYPAIPTPASSYALEDLTYAGFYGVDQLLYDPLYMFRSFSDTEIGPIDITGVPDEAIVDPGKIGVDETNDVLVLGTPANETPERIEMVYKKV